MKEIQRRYLILKLFFIALVCLAPLPAVAQDAANGDLAADLQVALNRAQLCSTLPDFDVAKVASILGVNLSIPPFIDTGARWDKDRHTVTSASLDDDRLSFEVRFGCQPSDDGALIRILPVSGDDLRLTDNGRCSGPQMQRVVELDCQISGELGRLFGAVTGLDQTISAAVAPVLQD